MRKFLYLLSLSLSLVSGLVADITSNLSNFIELKCSFEPATTRNARYKNKNENSEQGQTVPHLPMAEGLSLNWSGYASATQLSNPTPHSVSDVSGIWIVPQLAPTNDTTYSSLWLGIDGYGSDTVEQIGTEHDWSNGTQYNYAWFEMYPNPAYEIVGFPVNVGDIIQAEVEYIGNNQFRLSIVNYNQSVYTVIPSSFTTSSTAQRGSAEWIVEAPSTSSGPLPLADFQTATFKDCVAIINNITGGIQSSWWQADPLTMITESGTIKASPSGLSPNEESFSVVWEHE
jgi:hypothetical protein